MTAVTLADDLARLGLTDRRTEERTDNELGQEDFMTLMIAQFRNQDPFEPMDNGEFLGQLAQFGAVDGIDKLNKSFTDLTSSIYSDQALTASNLVGHAVLAETQSGYLPEDGRLAGAIDLAAGAENVEIDVLDASGQLVQQFSLGQQPPGLAAFEWDGRTSLQEAAAPGRYRIEARVIRGVNVESADVLINAKVSSVSLGGATGRMTLNLEGGDALGMNQIRQIL